MASQAFVSYKLVNTINIFSKWYEYFNYMRRKIFKIIKQAVPESCPSENTNNCVYKKLLHCIRSINLFLLVYMANYVVTQGKPSNKNQTIILNLNWAKAKYYRVYIPIYV